MSWCGGGVGSFGEDCDDLFPRGGLTKKSDITIGDLGLSENVGLIFPMK